MCLESLFTVISPDLWPAKFPSSEYYFVWSTWSQCGGWYRNDAKVFSVSPVIAWLQLMAILRILGEMTKVASNISASNIGLFNSGVHLIQLGTKTVFSFAPPPPSLFASFLWIFFIVQWRNWLQSCFFAVYRTLRLSQAFAPSGNHVIGSAIKDIRFNKLNTCAAIFIWCAKLFLISIVRGTW